MTHIHAVGEAVMSPLFNLGLAAFAFVAVVAAIRTIGRGT